MVDEPEVLLDLRVTGVVPIDQARAGDLAEQELVITINRELLERLASLRPQLEAARFRLRQDLLQQLVDPLDERPLLGFALFIQLGAELRVFGRVLLAAHDEVEQLLGVVLHLDAAEMQHDGGCLHARGELEGLPGELLGHLPLALALGGELVKVGRGISDTHGQGAKVMQAGNLYLACIHGLQDAGQQADARAVAQFGVSEAQFTDFAQHGAPIGVAMGVPTGGKGIHYRKRGPE